MVRRRDFERALAYGQRVADEHLRVWALPSGRPGPRLGLIVSRRFGNAVRRNRIKRLVREAFRLRQDELPAGLDLICAPQGGGRGELPGRDEYEQSLVTLSRKAARRLGVSGEPA